MLNSERFLNAFACIEKECRIIAGNIQYVKFYQLLHEAGKKSEVIQKYQFDLQEYADLRNAIVHQRSPMGETIAEPNEDVTERIEKIAKLLSEPERVEQFFIKPIRTCTLEDNLKEIALQLEVHESTKIPVYREHQFCFLLTTDMIERCFLHHEDSISQLKVKDCEAYLKETENVGFISKDTSIHDAFARFTKAYTNGIILKAVIITESGNREEKPCGIITLSDLIHSKQD